ncbi:WecB/TagA/CpsF family glycosyltransferase [Terriglobus aquaticus]|uniref:WecB/TagA/CpsF family glycosyltransferase n=1 Tax=Terriglobus aquaticus TaxID=940139 RepID=A0ABW9KKC0_9BACT|nr:WecB/TagA/CpsF family glycosyltransferase [Terriglobus aquaticus]
MQASEPAHTETVLGVRFFMGDVHAAVDRMLRGGLLVVPAAPALKDLQTQPAYRQALLEADLVIADSAFMVLVWNHLVARRCGGRKLLRLSGLEYLRELLQRPQVRSEGSTFWIMAGERSAARNLAWLAEQGIVVPDTHVYNAPMYGAMDGTDLEDPVLLERLEQLRPQHVVVTIGGGTQERLGLYLRRRLSFVPGIHCIGAAIAFLSGDQAAIPVWADKMYLGWLLRTIESPSRYGPRYWAARKLLQLMVRYGPNLPPAIPNGADRTGKKLPV